MRAITSISRSVTGFFRQLGNRLHITRVQNSYDPPQTVTSSIYSETAGNGTNRFSSSLKSDFVLNKAKDFSKPSDYLNNEAAGTEGPTLQPTPPPFSGLLSNLTPSQLVNIIQPQPETSDLINQAGLSESSLIRPQRKEYIALFKRLSTNSQKEYLQDLADCIYGSTHSSEVTEQENTLLGASLRITLTHNETSDSKTLTQNELMDQALEIEERGLLDDDDTKVDRKNYNPKQTEAIRNVLLCLLRKVETDYQSGLDSADEGKKNTEKLKMSARDEHTISMRPQIEIRGARQKKNPDVLLVIEEDSGSKAIFSDKKRPEFQPILKKITKEAMLERSKEEDCRQKEWKKLTTPPETPLNENKINKVSFAPTAKYANLNDIDRRLADTENSSDHSVQSTDF